jgi:cytochrome oxidase Cu insertion factor (SCO1/SenC/PrrC family)
MRFFYRQQACTWIRGSALRQIAIGFVCAVGLISNSSLGANITSPGAVISGNFRLVEHTGRAVDKHSYDGKLRLVFFGFTNCPLICPTTMAEVARVLRLLEPSEDKVQVLFITIDPEVDTVERLAEYVPAFHPAIIGLTGSEQQIHAAANGFNTIYGKSEGVNAEIFHSSYLYLMDSEGEFIDVFGYGTHADTIAKTVRGYM